MKYCWWNDLSVCLGNYVGVYRNFICSRSEVLNLLCRMFSFGNLMKHRTPSEDRGFFTLRRGEEKLPLCSGLRLVERLFRKPVLFLGVGRCLPRLPDQGVLRQVSDSTRQPPKPPSAPQLERSLFFFSLWGGKAWRGKAKAFFFPNLVIDIHLAEDLSGVIWRNSL